MLTIPKMTIPQITQDQLEEMTGLTGAELLDWLSDKLEQKLEAEWFVYNKAKMKRHEAVTYVKLKLKE